MKIAITGETNIFGNSAIEAISSHGREFAALYRPKSSRSLDESYAMASHYVAGKAALESFVRGYVEAADYCQRGF